MMNVIIKFTQMWPMIYRNEKIIHWKTLLNNEVCCLLALVIQQFQANWKKFLHVKSPPPTNQLFEIGDPGNNLWRTFQQNTPISSVDFDLGLNSLEIMKELKSSKLIMVYKDDSIPWKLSNEVLCLLALIQQRANFKKFLHVKPPPSNQLPEIENPGKTFLTAFVQNTQTSTEPFREIVRTAIQESAAPQKIIPQPAPPSEEEGSRRIGEDDNFDITILHDFTPTSMEKATALGSSLVQNQFSVFLPQCPELTQLTLNAINRSKVVIALLTPGFINSPNKRNEFSLALIKHSLRVPPLRLLPLIIDLTIMVDQSNLHPVFDRERSFYCLPQGDVNCVAHRGLSRVGDDIEVSERFQFLVQNENGGDLNENQINALNQWIENYNSNSPNDCPIGLPNNFIGGGPATNGRILIDYVQL